MGSSMSCGEDGQGGDSNGTYSFALQGAGMAIIAACSSLGAGFSFWVAHVKQTETTQNAKAKFKCIASLLVALKGLGTGVTISTALIHLIAEAFESFEENCWVEKTGYDAWPMVFAMIGIIILGGVDFHARRVQVEEQANRASIKYGSNDETRRSASRLNPEALMDVDHGHGHGNHHHGHHDHQSNTGSPSVETSTNRMQMNTQSIEEPPADDDIEEKRRTAALMEGSVVTHSIIIGLDLGLQNADGWRGLVVALAFHQFFEGIALAQVIAEAHYGSLMRSAVALFVFVCTTPSGVAVGMIVRAATGADETPTGVTTLIGILNSLCGGFLLYIGMINLLVPWFVQDQALLRASRAYAVNGWCFVAIGMAAMAIVGIWA